MGLWCPFFVRLSTVDWDDEIGHELSKEWNSLVSEIEFLSLFTFPRQYSWLKEGKYEVHVFTDASNYSMGACVYLTKRCGNIIESSLVLGKSRLFPQTQISRFSIARKELLGLCMGADLLNQCIMRFTISIAEIYVWVDSVIVIKWYQCSSKQLVQFVRNCVDKVMSAAEGRCPGYIQSTVNPADIASRGIGVKQRKKCEL